VPAGPAGPPPITKCKDYVWGKIQWIINDATSYKAYFFYVLGFFCAWRSQLKNICTQQNSSCALMLLSKYAQLKGKKIMKFICPRNQ
jgi:hypothetical protein